MSGAYMLAVIIVAVIAMILAISKLKIHPFIVMTVIAIAVGLLCGMNTEDVIVKVKAGFGNILASIGIVILSGTIIVGCSHPGILNMTASVAAHFGKPVSAVYGGSHLVEADDERIRKTIEELQKKGVRKTGFCHCSGNRVHEIIAETNAVTDCRLATGSVVVL